MGLLAVLALVGPGAGVAGAQQPPGPDGDGSDYFVTIAARQCPTYTDIRANRARNNIQESLKDLGPDTPYTAGQPISPAIEDATQPNCTPITGWKFTLGTRDRRRPCPGPWGSLSVVTVAVRRPDVTTLGVGSRARRHGGVRSRCATDPGRRRRSSSPPPGRARGEVEHAVDPGRHADRSRARGDPAFADEYGFGALRCAIDNLNGDNVEWIQFPAGSRHVYCYAYYVTPPPTSGTIIVRKQVTDPPNGRPDLHVRGQRLVHARPARSP